MVPPADGMRTTRVGTSGPSLRVARPFGPTLFAGKVGGRRPMVRPAGHMECSLMRSRILVVFLGLVLSAAGAACSSGGVPPRSSVRFRAVPTPGGGLLRRRRLLWLASRPATALVFVEKRLECSHNIRPGVRVGEAGKRHGLSGSEDPVEVVIRFLPRASVGRAPELGKVGRDAFRNRLGERVVAASQRGAACAEPCTGSPPSVPFVRDSDR